MTYGPRGLWQTSVAITSGDTPRMVEQMAFRLIDPPAGWDLALEATLYDLTVAISMQRGAGVQLAWRLGPPQGSGYERVTALRFLLALRGGGVMQIQSIDPDYGAVDYPLVDEGEDDLHELAVELDAWEAVELLEAHCRTTIPRPDSPDDDQRWWRDVLIAAAVVRRRWVRVPVEAGSFRLDPAAPGVPAPGDVVDIRLYWPAETRVLDTVIALGLHSGVADVKVSEVTEIDGGHEITYVPATDEPIDMEPVDPPV